MPYSIGTKICLENGVHKRLIGTRNERGFAVHLQINF
jgi:hypothetical protein